MTRPFDFENGLHEIARARTHGDRLMIETARLSDQIADGFRADFGTTLDMETVGKALVIAAASLVPLAGEREIPGAVLVNMIGLAGENLVRMARRRGGDRT